MNDVVFQSLYINLRNITFTGEDIEKVTQNLASNKKGDGHDNKTLSNHL